MLKALIEMNFYLTLSFNTDAAFQLENGSAITGKL